MFKKLTLSCIGAVIIALLIVAGCSKKENPVAPAITGTITGVVTDTANGTAIAGVSITTNPATSSVTTDITGQYTITAVNAGTYTVTAVKTGYNSKNVTVAVTAGNTVTVNIALAVGAPGNNAPNAPGSPSPANNAINQSTSLILSWTCTDPDEGDTLKYDVYFGTTNPPTTAVSTNQSAASIVCSGLENSTIYYWKIVAKDNHSSATAGPVWCFTTEPRPIEWITIPAGNFTMGSLPGDPYAKTDEQPQHTVYLDAYQISKYEVTNSQYKAFMDDGGYNNSIYWTADGWNWRTSNASTEPVWWSSGSYNSGTAFPSHPVVGVSWYEAYAFCNWAGGHLPTEAQWEKAARGTNSSNYWPWGSTWDASKCNSGENVTPDTFTYSSPVGFFSTGQSPYGVYDMAGNVWEWVNDWHYSAYYSDPGANTNPTGPTTGTYRVVRGGGSWFHGAEWCRVAARGYNTPDYRHSYNGIYGFRPAK
ncbi:SUMF1/EgtB/PvdO family nonheme iron enzyme [candidate division TA06 bacterium]|uniref:SUMF1/EgtB/PvdO family nonheme iron enzyme n=1 Tax=candidate division TA06 bacterium TaxID=2250710 RepID=A0A933IB32_UNCT6|nr:SUMF1/EgtB/PvdO family nonheme iron enzyme [candidate division TA06 bacterium]